MDDDFDDADLWAAADVTTSRQPAQPQPQLQPQPQAVLKQPAPQKIQQPTPQRLDKLLPPKSSTSQTKIVQPTPQALPQRSSGSTILVSPRQRGNPLLASIKSTPWEYSDIPADYGLGLTTCALFLSLKYHRLHPEYIYNRIKNLQGKFNLRILLALVDITNHEDSLRELAKTSLINNVTLICCWSAAEAARYLELYKSYEHANFKAIQGQQGSSYVEKLVDFVTVLRGVNKADAVSLVSNFGSLKNAVNADPEQVGIIGGWGEVKVKRWCSAVEEPFRSRKAARRDAPTAAASGAGGDASISKLHQAIPVSAVPLREMPHVAQAQNGGQADSTTEALNHFESRSSDNQGEAGPGPRSATTKETDKRTSQPTPQASAQRPREQEELSDGVAAALAKLKQQAGLG